MNVPNCRRLEVNKTEVSIHLTHADPLRLPETAKFKRIECVCGGVLSECNFHSEADAHQHWEQRHVVN